jgi:mannose-6-phosphate isomerase-like protein (cupin superfamily)
MATSTASPYTVINVRDVKDAAPDFGLEEVNEVHFATEMLGAEQLGISFHRIHPGRRQGFGHHHEHQEEIYVLVDGSARIKLNDDIVEMQPWDILRIAPSVTRCVEAGDDGAELIFMGCRHASGGENDAQMEQDFWPAEADEESDED